MERSIADELYSDISKMADGESDPSSISDNLTSNLHESDGDDLWHDDEDMERQWQTRHDDEDMERQWQMRHEQFYTIGYRDGLMVGNEASAQGGFNMGFKESVFVGQTWGLIRGVTSALASFSDALKVRFVDAEETSNKLQNLHESVRAISTTDALKLFNNRRLT